MTAHEATGAKFGEDSAAVYPLVALQAAALTAEAMRLICRITPPLATGRVMAIDFENLSVKEVENWSRDPECPVCAHVDNDTDCLNKETSSLAKAT